MKKKIKFILSVTPILIIVFSKIAQANSPGPCYTYNNLTNNYWVILLAFLISTLFEIAVGYIFLKDKSGWLKAVVIANLISYPFFTLFLSLFLNNDCDPSFFSKGVGAFVMGGAQVSLSPFSLQLYNLLLAWPIIFGEIFVIFIESVVLNKILGTQISYRYSLLVSFISNLISWIAGGIIVYSIWYVYLLK